MYFPNQSSPTVCAIYLICVISLRLYRMYSPVPSRIWSMLSSMLKNSRRPVFNSGLRFRASLMQTVSRFRYLFSGRNEILQDAGTNYRLMRLRQRTIKRSSSVMLKIGFSAIRWRSVLTCRLRINCCLIIKIWYSLTDRLKIKKNLKKIRTWQMLIGCVMTALKQRSAFIPAIDGITVSLPLRCAGELTFHWSRTSTILRSIVQLIRRYGSSRLNGGSATRFGHASRLTDAILPMTRVRAGS